MYNKTAAKKQLSLAKIAFLDVKGTFRDTSLYSELQCLPRGNPRTLRETQGSDYWQLIHLIDYTRSRVIESVLSFLVLNMAND